jgi:molybdopterin synthase catalytic subunit
MRRQIIILREQIEGWVSPRGREISAEAGAVVVFWGIVRQTEQGEKISAIDYEAFEKMAVHQFHLICHQVAEKWPIESVRLAHRVGTVAVGEASVWAEVIAPHREEAFAACQFIIAEMKRVVPIWKHSLP